MPDIKKHLTTIQTLLAILVGLVTFTATTLTIKKNFFTEKLEGSLVGYVKDKITLRAIPNAVVEISDSSNAVILSQVSNANGSFEKNKLKEGTYTIKVSSQKYEPEVKGVSIIGKEKSEVTFSLTPIEKEKSAVTKALEQKAAEFISTFGKDVPKTGEGQTLSP